MKKDKRAFDDVICGIKNTEQDKDKFLKASRLSRYECDNRFSTMQKVEIINNILLLIGVIAGMACFCYLLTAAMR